MFIHKCANIYIYISIHVYTSINLHVYRHLYHVCPLVILQQKTAPGKPTPQMTVIEVKFTEVFCPEIHALIIFMQPLVAMIFFNIQYGLHKESAK